MKTNKTPEQIVKEVLIENGIDPTDYTINVVMPGKRLVNNLMSGTLVAIDADTPFCCDPSTETYWSM
jgi:ABC-type nitrate/sulfonate/bicarbonate transport system substrate-binding protein